MVEGSSKQTQSFLERGIFKYGLLVISGLVVIVLWEILTAATEIPSFIFPAPEKVWARFLTVLLDGSLAFHTAVTLTEVLLGLMLGVGSAIFLGYLLAKSTLVEKVLAPYIVASQSIPIVAIAPLLVIWLGPGIFSKVLTSALIVFFPVLVNTIVGIRSVPEELYDLMKILRANRWQKLTMLEIPASLPVFLGGLRIGATLAVIGAVVGEFVGADMGLGFLVNVGRGTYDTALVFVAIFVLIAMALTLYGTVVMLENRLLSWKKRGSEFNK